MTRQDEQQATLRMMLNTLHMTPDPEAQIDAVLSWVKDYVSEEQTSSYNQGYASGTADATN